MKKLLFSRFVVPWLLMLGAFFYFTSCKYFVSDGECDNDNDWEYHYTFKVIDVETGKNPFEPVLIDGINFVPNIKITDENGNPDRGRIVQKDFIEFLPLDTIGVAGKKYLTTYFVTLPDGDVDTLTFNYEYEKVCYDIFDKLISFDACYNGKSCSKSKPGDGIVTLKKFK